MKRIAAVTGLSKIIGGISAWADVQNAFDYWSERFRTRLAELRAAR